MISWALYGLMLVPSLAGGWEDVREGECLSVPELQELSGVEDAYIYSGGACNVIYLSMGAHLQQEECGVQLDAGSWTREMIRHREAGVFWPSPVPCQTSVKVARNHRKTWEPIGEVVACSSDEYRLAAVQDEVFTTKAFDAGQGVLYLPHPFVVTRRDYIPTQNGDIEFCTKSSVRLEYTGWGNLAGEVRNTSCDGREVQLCKKAKMSADEKPNGETCLRIEEITNCQQR